MLGILQTSQHSEFLQLLPLNPQLQRQPRSQVRRLFNIGPPVERQTTELIFQLITSVMVGLLKRIYGLECLETIFRLEGWLRTQALILDISSLGCLLIHIFVGKVSFRTKQHQFKRQNKFYSRVRNRFQFRTLNNFILDHYFMRR
jgi:hypothetical protein